MEDGRDKEDLKRIAHRLGLLQGELRKLHAGNVAHNAPSLAYSLQHDIDLLSQIIE